MEMKRESREAWNSTLQRHLRRRLMAPIACQQSEASHTGTHEKRQGTDGQGRDERPMWLCSHAFGEHARSIFYWRAKWKKDTADKEKKETTTQKRSMPRTRYAAKIHCLTHIKNKYTHKEKKKIKDETRNQRDKKARLLCLRLRNTTAQKHRGVSTNKHKAQKTGTNNLVHKAPFAQIKNNKK
ncbi:hypothetical protein, conserved in T. vivax [Trypanosoma vivax Y486]|uniref:Uncharacterized protein n=1 Tax=Trypanosoma vivax (strain Y486) TaxID=1055687 RepID=F9WNW3_TRYVY|nr:hypothetical protein, conserved in T. vivax [Trypanosoma vivax Y486]|eukprot:CCD19234.1 hypothetical protein, conserved in T. vivax [Trypanosoma vivax Y486]